MMATTFNISAGAIGLEVLRVYNTEMRYTNYSSCAVVLISHDGSFFCRKVPITDAGKWEDVEFLYRCMKLYNGVCMSWAEQILPLVLFSVCSAITVLLYVTVRPSGLPLIIYIWFPFVAFAGMFVVSWLVYDAVMVRRASEEVLGKLQSQTEYYYRRLSLFYRKELIPRARALRPVHLSFANFSDISLEVLTNVWDEVLNQLLFLLSL